MIIIIILLMSVGCYGNTSLTAHQASCVPNITARSLLSKIIQTSTFYFITDSALLDLASTNETLRKLLLSKTYNENMTAFGFQFCHFFDKDVQSCVYEKSTLFIMKSEWAYLVGGSIKKTFPMCGIGYGESGCGSYKHLISPCGNITAIETGPKQTFHFLPSDGKNCEWIITVGDGYAIELNFDYIQMQDCLASCECDYLKIFDVFNDTNMERAIVCGVHSRWTFISYSNKLKLTFHLQGYEHGTGFSASYKEIDANKVEILTEVQHVYGLNGSVELKQSEPTKRNGIQLIYEWIIRTEESRKIHVQWDVIKTCSSEVKITLYDGPGDNNIVITYVTTRESISGNAESSGFQMRIEITKSKNCLVDFNATFSSPMRIISLDSKRMENNTFYALKLAHDETKYLNAKAEVKIGNTFKGFVVTVPENLYVSMDIRKFTFEGSNQDDCAEEGMVLWDGLPGEGTKYGPYCGNLISLWMFNVPFRIRRGIRDEQRLGIDSKQTAIIHSSSNMFTVLFYWYSTPNAKPAEIQIVAKASDCVGVIGDWFNIQKTILNVTYTYEINDHGQAEDNITHINITPEPESCFVLQELPSNQIPMKENMQVNIFASTTRFTVSNLVISDPELSVCATDIKYIPRKFEVVQIRRKIDCTTSSMGIIVKFSNRKRFVCVNETLVGTHNIERLTKNEVTGMYFDAFCGSVLAINPKSYYFLTISLVPYFSVNFKLSFFAPYTKRQNHHYIFNYRYIGKRPSDNTLMAITIKQISGGMVLDTTSLSMRINELPFNWKSTWSEHVEMNLELLWHNSNVQLDFLLVPDDYSLSQHEVVCPNNHTTHLYGYKDYCYQIITFDKVQNNLETITWKEAEKVCTESGGTLLTIHTKEELKYIKSLLKHDLTRGRVFYIGLVTDGKGHRWVDGNPALLTDWYKRISRSTKIFRSLQHLPDDFFGEKVTFADIDRDQPTADQFTRCTAMLIASPFMSTNWIKIPCRYKYDRAGYICKYKSSGYNYTAEHKLPQHIAKNTEVLTNGTYTVLLAGTIQCPNGWTFSSNKCYRLLSSTEPINVVFTCTNASDACINHGGKLATITQSVFTHLKYLLDVFKHESSYGGIWVSNCIIIHAEKTDYSSTENFMLETNSSIVDEVLNVFCEANPHTKAHECKPKQFRCEDGTCILTHHVCDGQKDCIFGDDELNCSSSDMDFLCEDGFYIPFSKYCDFVSDCEDNSDEKNCTRSTCISGELHCDNGQCLASNKFNDKISDCLDGSDENEDYIGGECAHFTCNYGNCIPEEFVNNYRLDCEGTSQEDEVFLEKEVNRGKWIIRLPNLRYATFENYKPYCPTGNGSHVRCSKSNSYCFPRHKACIYETDKYGYMGGCSDGSHLISCEEFQCPSLFKCPQSYCIPLHKICDGVIDCLGGADEDECEALSCPGMFKCRKEGYCIDQSLICDGIYHCRDSHEDELFCSIDCPLGCICIERSVNCAFNGFSKIPLFSPETRSLVLTGNNIEFSNSTSLRYQYLGQLKLNNNRVNHLAKGIFIYLGNLLTLDLRENMLEHLSNGMFYGLNSLQHLYMSGNPVHSLGEASFSGMNTIPILLLTNLGINFLDAKAFTELPNLKYLSLTNNSINHLNSSIFYGATSILKLDLKGNDISYAESKTFNTMEKLAELNTDDFKLCCFAKHVRVCTPSSDAFSSCENLIANEVLRVIIWVLGFLALIGNTFIVIWKACTQEKKTHSILVINLGISDLLMGLYLIIIVSADQFYKGKYMMFADSWRNSHLCKFAGFLSTVSTEMSVYTLVVITADRLSNILFTGRKLNFNHAVSVCVIGWVTFIILSFLPLTNLSYFGESFVKHGVCLLLDISAGKTQGWEYMYFSLLLFNLLSFTFIFVSCIVIYYSTDKMREKISHEVLNPEILILKQFVPIVITDIICWIPLIFTAFLALGGTSVNPEASAWLVMLLLPINSAINPYLYIISTLGQRRK